MLEISMNLDMAVNKQCRKKKGKKIIHKLVSFSPTCKTFHDIAVDSFPENVRFFNSEF